MSITRQPFGEANGVPVELYTLRNASALEAQIMTYGGIVVALRSHGDDMVLGFERLQDYLDDNSPYFGSLIGRTTNRIAAGRFSLDGKTYQLACNNGENHLHGGTRGFDKVVWQAEELPDEAAPALALRYQSKDGEEGYPGNLDVRVVYTLTPDQALRIEYHATTDQATLVDLTNHSYFNLEGAGDVLGHSMHLMASQVLPVVAGLIPTGERRVVADTPFDFRQPTLIGAHIHDDDEQLRLANGGFDLTYILDSSPGTLAARVVAPSSGHVLEVFTSEPALQFYSGNFLDGSLRGKSGQLYVKHAGFCLEAQHFPNAANQPDFPSIVLRPGETYQQTTTYRFGRADAFGSSDP